MIPTPANSSSSLSPSLSSDFAAPRFDALFALLFSVFSEDLPFLFRGLSSSLSEDSELEMNSLLLKEAPAPAVEGAKGFFGLADDFFFLGLVSVGLEGLKTMAWFLFYNKQAANFKGILRLVSK